MGKVKIILLECDHAALENLKHLLHCQGYAVLDTSVSEEVYGQLEIACHKHCVEETVVEHIRALEALHEVTLDIGLELELADLLGRTVERAIDLIRPARGGALYLYQPEKDKLQCVAAQGKRQAHEVGCHLRIDEGRIGQVFQSGVSYCQEDDTLLIVPMCWHNQIIGVLVLDDGAQQVPFNGRDLRLAEMFAAQAAVAINNADLHQALRLHAQELDEDVRLKRGQMQAILENIHDAILLTDPQGIIQYVNPAFTALLGYEPSDMIGFSTHKACELSAHEQEEKRQTLLAGQAWRSETAMCHKDGGLRELEIVVVPLFSPGGEISNFVASLHDIGRFKQFDRMKTYFMKSVSHELRTPLSNLRLYVQLLRSGQKSEKRTEYLRILESQTQRLMRVTQKIIDATRFADQDAIGEWRPILVSTLLANAAARFQFQADSANITFITGLSGDKLVVQGDATWLARALDELVENAITFTPKGGTVRVVARRLQKNVSARVAIHVQDTGSGIRREELEQILQHDFMRGHIGDVGDIPGIGLGLTIVRMVLARHGGDLTVESSCEGSTFTLLLPLVE